MEKRIDRYQKPKAKGYEEPKFLLPPGLWDRFLSMCIILDLNIDELVASFIEDWLSKLDTADLFETLLRSRIESTETKGFTLLTIPSISTGSERREGGDNPTATNYGSVSVDV